MKIKPGYLMRNVAGVHVVLPVGQVDFDGMIKLNETGVLLWEKLQNDVLPEDLVSALLAEYDVDRVTAENDVNAFLAKLKQADLIDE